MKRKALAVLLILCVLMATGCSRKPDGIVMPENSSTSTKLTVLTDKEDTFILCGGSLWKADNGETIILKDNISYRGRPVPYDGDIYYINALDMDKLYKLDISSGRIAK